MLKITIKKEGFPREVEIEGSTEEITKVLRGLYYREYKTGAYPREKMKTKGNCIICGNPLPAGKIKYCSEACYKKGMKKIYERYKKRREMERKRKEKESLNENKLGEVNSKLDERNTTDTTW